MKTAKNILYLLLIMALSLLFISCGGQTAPTEPAGTSKEETTQAAPATQEAPAESTSEEAAFTTEAVTEAPTTEAPATEPEKEDVFPTAGIPTLEILIDESKGTIKAMNSDPEHETRCYGEIRIDIPAGYQSEYGGAVYEEETSETYALEYIRGRGNSTWGRDKKPYKIKLDQKADLFGMGAEKNWVLLANYFDCTMLRNKLTYKLGEWFFPEGTFVPQNVFVNVKMNGEYLGLYCLSESVRLSKERVPVEEPSYAPDAKEEELIGGYLLTNEDMGSDTTIVRTDRYTFLIDTPETEEITDLQKEYISDFLQKVEDSVCCPERMTESIPYEELMDVDSYVDYFLIQEMSANGDGFKSDSCYYYQDQNGKLVFGPLWDFDYVAWSGDLREPEGFVTLEYAPWLNVLLQDESFRAKLTARWEELKPLLVSMAEEGGWIDRYAEAIQEDRIKNYETASTFLWEEPELPGEHNDDEDYVPKESLTEEEIAERKQTFSCEAELKRLKDWILQRTEWIDAHIKEIRSERVHMEFMDGTEMIRYQVLSSGEDLLEELVPVPEKKAGVRFTGWVRKEQGQKVPLALDDPTRLGLDTIVYQAEWEPYDPAEDLAGLAFPEKVYYADTFAYLDIAGMASAAPFDFDKEFLTMTAECEPEDCAYPSDLYLSVSGEGEVRITLSCGDKTASCKIILLEEEKLILPKDYSVPETMELKAGEYGFISMKPEDGAMVIARREYDKPVFTVEDPQIAEIDANGYVHGLQAGTTKITIEDEGLQKTWSLTLTVK